MATQVPRGLGQSSWPPRRPQTSPVGHGAATEMSWSVAAAAAGASVHQGGRPDKHPLPSPADPNRAWWRLAAGRSLGLAAGPERAEAEGLVQRGWA